jgi:hypothetical protein
LSRAVPAVRSQRRGLSFGLRPPVIAVQATAVDGIEQCPSNALECDPPLENSRPLIVEAIRALPPSIRARSE